MIILLKPLTLLIHDFEEKTGVVIEFDQMEDALKKLGYVVKYSIIKNIKVKPRFNQKVKPVGDNQTTTGGSIDDY